MINKDGGKYNEKKKSPSLAVNNKFLFYNKNKFVRSEKLLHSNRTNGHGKKRWK